jgi:hypothetical protein
MLRKLPAAVGRLLIRRRAGIDGTVCSRLRTRQVSEAFIISSSFADGGPLPISCTADGKGLSPALRWGNTSAEIESLALIVEDADSPTPHPLVHAIAVDIGNGILSLAEGSLGADDPGGQFRMGRNSYLREAWLAPDPPPAHGPHRYVFQLFALKPGGRGFSGRPGRGELIDIVLERAIAVGIITGTYERTA